MSLKRRIKNLEKNLPHGNETFIIQWDEPGPLTHLASGGMTWQREADETEALFIDRVKGVAGNVCCLWGVV